jgi:predicted nicotinamide N-methyase
MSLPDPSTTEVAPWLEAMAEFVESETQPTRLAYVPEITLRLGGETLPLWQKIEFGLKLHLAPPYWAFAWPSGLALARHVLDHPALVAGRRVLDFAAGSGLVGIAAAKRGAAHVAATDVDPLAAVAIAFNADLNGVAIAESVEDVMSEDSGFDPASVDVVLVADMFFTPEIAAQVFAFLERCRAAGCEVLIADPGRPDLPVARLEKLSSHDVPAAHDCQLFGTPADDPSRQDPRVTHVWRLAR